MKIDATAKVDASGIVGHIVVDSYNNTLECVAENK